MEETPSDADKIEGRRRLLLANNQFIDLQDPGAGSLVSRSAQRSISSIARHSLSSPVFCSLLFRLAKFQQPETILEIGTSLGISASYIAAGAPKSSFATIEGSPAIAAFAKETFQYLQLPNIRLLEGKAQDLLPAYLRSIPGLDFIFIDAHHSEEATLSFFHLLQKSLHTQSILVVGDIHWSVDMERAWGKLRKHESVSLAIDIFHAGILFFNPSLRKETEILWV